MTSNRTEVPDGLVRAAMGGDRAAVERILAEIRPRVVRYCRARLGVDWSAAADDIAQEVCLAVLTGLSGYRFEQKPFMAFVYGIAAHKVIDAHRAARRTRWDLNVEIPDSADAAEGPEQHALRAELSGALRRLLDELPGPQREILVLRVAMGLSAEETAATVGSTPGAVRVAQHRALARLRRLATASVPDRRGVEADQGVEDQLTDLLPVQRRGDAVEGPPHDGVGIVSVQASARSTGSVSSWAVHRAYQLGHAELSEVAGEREHEAGEVVAQVG